MTSVSNFREEYDRAALELLKFISYDGFHKFHVTTRAMKLDRLLGMPWRINLPDNPLYVSFSGVARNERNNTEEIRFSSPGFAGDAEKKDFDNVARLEAPQRLSLIRMHIQYLRDANNPARRPKHDPDWQPSIDVTDMPSEEEMQRRFAAAKEQLAATRKEMAEQNKFYDDILAAHDRNRINGREALYSDVQQLVRQEAAQTDDALNRNYYDWLERYLEQKKLGKTDKDILPLKLDTDFPELAPLRKGLSPAL